MDDFRLEMNSLRGEMNGLREEMNNLHREMMEFMLWGFGITFAGIFALIGFVIWDRQTALSPAVERAGSSRKGRKNWKKH